MGGSTCVELPSSGLCGKLVKSGSAAVYTVLVWCYTRIVHVVSENSLNRLGGRK